MGRKKESAENPQSTNWKLLLYPDNEVHSKAIQTLQVDFQACCLWIEHFSYDLDGNKILEGSGKPHLHFAVKLDKPVRQGALCKRLGLLDSDSGLPDIQFIRPVSGRFERWLVYLTHISEPDKEQYSVKDLHGSSALIAQYERAALDYQTSELSTRDCVRACMEWIRQQGDRIIKSSDFAWWVVQTPYFKARNDRLVLSCLQEHNDIIYSKQREETISAFSSYQPIQKVSGGRDDFFSFNSDDWEDL